MGKWNERMVINFLKAYRQHPCLWNPYHRDYYNCYEKNEALQKIIDHLGAPDLAVSDYLQQIKIIREKYKQEQTRTIKSLQTRKQYKSPFPWYNIVADMLMKVIDDEEKIKQRNGYSTLRSLSSDNIKNFQKKEELGIEAKWSKTVPCNNTTCDRMFSRSKSVEKTSRWDKKPSSKGKTVMKEKTDKKVRYIPCLQYMTKQDRSSDPEDSTLSSKPTRDTDFVEASEYVIGPSASMDCRCSGSSSLTKKSGKIEESSFLKCPSCGWENVKYKKVVPCSEYSKNLTGVMYTPCPGCDNTAQDAIPYRSEYAKKYMDNSGDFGVQRNLSKQTETVSDKEVQFENAEERSRDRVAVATLAESQITQGESVIANTLKCGAIEASTQLKIILSNVNKDCQATGAVARESVCKNTQCVQCVKVGSLAKGTQFCLEDICPSCTKIDRGVNTVTTARKQMQDATCTPCGMKKCISIQTLCQTEEKGTEEDRYSGQRAVESKKLMANMIEQSSKGVQCTICISRGNLAYVLPQKMTEVGTTMSAHQIRNVGCMTSARVKEAKSKYVQCIQNDESLHLSKEKCSKKCCTQSLDLQQPVETKIEGELDAPCIRDTCPLNILNLVEENPAMAVILQQFLRKILFKHGQSAQDEYKFESKGTCLTNAMEITEAIKEYMKEFCEQLDNSSFPQFVETKPNFVDTSTTCDGRLCTREESAFHPAFQSSITEEGKTSPMESVCKKFPIVHKEACACSDYNSTVTYEKGVAEKISVGTQKRDPIVVRVIKYCGNQAALRSEKETLTMVSDTDHEKQCTDKRVETCGRKTCIPAPICEKVNEAKLEPCTRKVTFKDDICDKSCKGGRYDWTDVTNIDINVSNSKIPQCVRQRKYKL